MPDNKKNGLRAEPAIGTVNTDLSLTTPRSDPRFIPEKDAPESDSAFDAPGLTVTGKTPNAKIAVPAVQRVPERPPVKNPILFQAQTRKRS